MDTDKDNVINYIAENRKRGVLDRRIREALVSAGWSALWVDHIFTDLDNATPLVSMEGLYKEYRPSESVRTVAIDGIDNLKIYSGEFLSITGPSGSGKSTLLNLLGIIDEPTRGTLRIDGADVATMSEKEKTNLRLTRLSYVFQFFNLLENFTAVENIMFQLQLQGTSYAQAKERAFEILGFLDLKERAWSYPSELSGGQQQRVAIGRAIAKDSQLLLADEPTAHLDTKNAYNIVSILRRVNEELGKTVVHVTHEREYAVEADRMVVLVNGKVDAVEVISRKK